MLFKSFMFSSLLALVASQQQLRKLFNRFGECSRAMESSVKSLGGKISQGNVKWKLISRGLLLYSN